MKNELFTIVLAHYNQMQYIKTALQSILNQNYSNIELIITDDASTNFNKEEIVAYIEKHKKMNLKHYEFVINAKNEGTVKTLNRAIKISKGDFILFFASDDELHDENVISNFIEQFQDKNKQVVTSQCAMYNFDLTMRYELYVNEEEAFKLNEVSSFEQYVRMSKSCIYSAGATAYRKNIFKKYGYFNENYKLVEDWAYWLYLLRSGVKMYYSDFITLNHRDGGVSHNRLENGIPPHVIQYYKDILTIYEKEVMEYFNNFSIHDKYEIYERYKIHVDMYARYFGEEVVLYNKKCSDILLQDKKFARYYYFKTVFMGRLLNRFFLFRNKVTLLYTVIIWFLLNYRLLNIISFSNPIFYLSAMIGDFVILFIFMKKVCDQGKIFAISNFIWLFLNFLFLEYYTSNMSFDTTVWLLGSYFVTYTILFGLYWLGKYIGKKWRAK